MNQSYVRGTGMGRSVVHTYVYIQRLGCLHRSHRIQMGLEGGLGEGGKIGLGNG